MSIGRNNVTDLKHQFWKVIRLQLECLFYYQLRSQFWIKPEFQIKNQIENHVAMALGEQW